MKTIGRLMQQLALVMLPIAILLEISGGLSRSFGVADLLKALVFAIVLFVLGRLIEGYGR